MGRRVEETRRPAPLIWALDIATVTGWAVGRPGDKPVAHSIRFAKALASSDELFLGCYGWFSERLARGPKPDVLAIEELLPPTARRGATSTGAQHRLAGLHGIIRALAKHANIPEIIGAHVGDVRQHFIHDRATPRAEAKRAVLHMCKMLGWPAADDDCGDALALWSYTASLYDPAQALAVTPLFGSWDEVARARESRR
jgi:crossover junction endodeoxyribonuclease RuvC